MPTTATTESRVRTLLVNEGFEDDSPVTATLESLNFDSLDRTEFGMALEDEFGFEVAPDDECEWVTLLDVVQYVDRNTAK